MFFKSLEIFKILSLSQINGFLGQAHGTLNSPFLLTLNKPLKHVLFKNINLDALKICSFEYSSKLKLFNELLNKDLIS